MLTMAHHAASIVAACAKVLVSLIIFGSFSANSFHITSFGGRAQLHRSQKQHISTSWLPNSHPFKHDFSLKAQIAAPDEKTAVNIVAIIPEDKESPFRTKWEELFEHMATKLTWYNEKFVLHTITEASASSKSPENLEIMKNSDVLFASSVFDQRAVDFISSSAAEIPTRICLECAPALKPLNKLGGLEPEGNPLVSFLGSKLWAKQDAQAWDFVKLLYSRHTADDLLFSLLILVHSYHAEVPEVAGGLKSTGLDTLACMFTNCRQQIVDCVTDERCKTGLDCLTACPPNDQVCAYRCIASYETPQFEQFSLCVLQRNNCLGNKADIPMTPEVTPLQTWRGEPLTRTTAQDILIGWLGQEQWSWKVVLGQNPAYDFFPDQHQIFYRAKGKGAMWYDPVFKVETLDGRKVWRRRHYKVREGPAVGEFYFSVLDNGVTSKEYWRILDCADDLSWACLYYAGAASAAGQTYRGSLLVTRDGYWPADDQRERIGKAFDKAGIKMWEMYSVKNNNPQDAPLGVDEEYKQYNPFLR